VALGVARHEVGVLDIADGTALRVLTGDQVDRLAPAPLFLFADKLLDVADVDWHAGSFRSALVASRDP
jgi:hypothetical protein